MKTRTIHIPDNACFFVLYPNMHAEINVPQFPPEEEIPLYCKYVVAFVRLVYEGDPELDRLITKKWNELVDGYKEAKCK